MKKIAIIGGGAAGMMCAATILELADEKGLMETCEIRVYEKNAVLGKKVSISGGGRCNVTTGISDKKTLLSKYTRGADFLKGSLGRFGPKKVYEWFESHGVPLKCESDQRVFPVSDNGSDVIGAFESVFRKYGKQVDIFRSTTVSDIRSEGKKYAVETGEEVFLADTLVITTGGNAYAHTGSSGDGYTFARQLGHTITQLGPSLNSFETLETFPADISGISLAKARLFWNAKTSTDGPMIFTHFGISGPAPFAFSSLVPFEKIEKASPLPIALAPLAGWGMPEWDSYLEKEAKAHSAREVRNILENLPRRLVDALGKAGILSNKVLDQKGATLSRDDRKAIARILGEGIPLRLVARRAGDEFVTAGGVDFVEINDETLESKTSPGLYFAGEVLNIDGVTGGFNLQAAWSTGRAVGKSIVAVLELSSGNPS